MLQWFEDIDPSVTKYSFKSALVTWFGLAGLMTAVFVWLTYLAEKDMAFTDPSKFTLPQELVAIGVMTFAVSLLVVSLITDMFIFHFATRYSFATQKKNSNHA